MTNDLKRIFYIILYTEIWHLMWLCFDTGSFKHLYKGIQNEEDVNIV